MERMSRASSFGIRAGQSKRSSGCSDQKLLQIQERYVQAASNNREILNVARLARNQIQEHLAMLETIQKELGR